MSLQEGIVPLEWKEANIIPLFKKGSRNKSVNYRPVSLTSVICKLLETIESALARIETCIIEVAAWMAKNDLTLNAEKSQAIIFQTSKHRVNKQPEVCVEIAGHRIALSTGVRNLGVVFDSRLNMEEQVAQTAESCYYQLRNIGQIRSSITEGACRTLVHALVTSRLDYGNRLLYGIPQVTIQRLQRIQNCAARIVTRTRKYEHITPVLRLLHWLPVRQRTLFKVLVFTYCALNATAPNYLVQLINHRPLSRKRHCCARNR